MVLQMLKAINSVFFRCNTNLLFRIFAAQKLIINGTSDGAPYFH